MGFSSFKISLLRASGFIALFSAAVYLQGCGGAGPEAFAPEGKWVIDKEATGEYARQSPRWKEEDEENLPRMLDMLAGMYFLEISADSIAIEARGRRMEIPAEIVESSGSRRVYGGVFGGREVVFTAESRGKENINLRSSMSDDFDYILWKRDDR